MPSLRTCAHACGRRRPAYASRGGCDPLATIHTSPAAPCSAGLSSSRRPWFDQGMPRSTDRNTFKREAERTLPHRVDIPVPEGGLGRRLNEMQAWCRAHVAPGAWADHGHSEKRKGDAPAYFAWFYFAKETDAGAFRKLWAAN